MGEFFKAFEERIQLEKDLIEDREAQEEVEAMVKEYKAIIKHKEKLRYPTLEQLLDVEKTLFEIKNRIQRGHAYNFLLNRKYSQDFERRKENIRKLQEKQNVDNNTVCTISPHIEEKTYLRFCNRKELEREQEQILEQNHQLSEENMQLKQEVKSKTAEILELRKQIEHLTLENAELSKNLEFEKRLHEKEVKDLQEANLKKLQSLIKTTISKEFKPIQKCIEDTSVATNTSFNSITTDVKSVKKTLSEVSKTTKKVSKDSSELVDLTKQTIDSKLKFNSRHWKIEQRDERRNR